MARDMKLAAGGRSSQLAARWINIILGAWLFISAFVWQHTASEQTNSWILGLIIVAAGVIALVVPAVRYVNTVASVYLFVSTLLMPHSLAWTAWHNCILAVIVFALSLTPSTPVTGTHRAQVPA